ncbi:MAG: DUF1217 domain-containing protein [Pseudaminobacter sp.]
MLNTLTSYQIIARNLTASLERVGKQPMVDRETKYYLENITKVKTIEEFVADTRLFKYAMKAHGLEDMAYAKAFMVKAMKEGITDKTSFANKLTDKRYAEFVASYNFAALGEQATTYVKAQHGTVTNYRTQALIADLDPEMVKTETAYYLENIGNVRSIDDLLADSRLFDYAMTAFGMDPEIDTRESIRKMLEGGVRDPDSPANKATEPRYSAFVSTFNFEAHGEAATTYSLAQQPAVDKYMRQTLEENAGAQNEGVRLALYFQRKASSITSFYQVLGDPALAQVVRTALGLPSSFATADIDTQARFFESRLKIEDFSNPEALGKFLTRFTSLWEIENPTAPAQTSLSVLFSQPVEYGISPNLLLTIHKMKS